MPRDSVHITPYPPSDSLIKAGPDPLPIFTREQLLYLVRNRHLLPSKQNCITLPTYLLHPPIIASEITGYDLAPSAQDHIAPEDDKRLPPLSQIPQHLNSVETLLFLGFAHQPAKDIWEAFCSLHHVLPKHQQTVLCWVIEHFESAWAQLSTVQKNNMDAPEWFIWLVEDLGFEERSAMVMVSQMKAVEVPGVRIGGWVRTWCVQRWKGLERAGRCLEMHRMMEVLDAEEKRERTRGADGRFEPVWITTRRKCWRGKRVEHHQFGVAGVKAEEAILKEFEMGLADMDRGIDRRERVRREMGLIPWLEIHGAALSD